MKFQVSRTNHEFPRFPGQIMKFQVFPETCKPCHCDRVRRDGLVTRAEDRCCVECPSALIRCGGLNPTCRKPSGPEPLLSPHSAAPRRPSSSIAAADTTFLTYQTTRLDSRPSIHQEYDTVVLTMWDINDVSESRRRMTTKNSLITVKATLPPLRLCQIVHP